MVKTEEYALVQGLVGTALDRADVEYLAERVERVEGGPGQTLVRRGDHGDALYLVVSGELAVHVDVDGERHDLATIGPGSWVGELHFIDPGPATASVTSASDFVALRMASGELPRLIEDNPHAASSLLRVLIREVAQRLVSAGSDADEQRNPSDDPHTDAARGWWDGMFGRLFGAGGA